MWAENNNRTLCFVNLYSLKILSSISSLLRKLRLTDFKGLAHFIYTLHLSLLLLHVQLIRLVNLNTHYRNIFKNLFKRFKSNDICFISLGHFLKLKDWIQFPQISFFLHIQANDLFCGISGEEWTPGLIQLCWYPSWHQHERSGLSSFYPRRFNAGF